MKRNPMEKHQESNTPENNNPWNKREQKSSWLLYLVIIVFCLGLAYILSGTAG